MYLKSITVSFQLASSVLSLTQIYLLTSIPLSTHDAFPLVRILLSHNRSNGTASSPPGNPQSSPTGSQGSVEDLHLISQRLEGLNSASVLSTHDHGQEWNI